MIKFKNFLTQNKLVYISALVITVAGIPINYFFLRDRQDNAFEEFEETLIKELTGLDIDLTPESEEK